MRIGAWRTEETTGGGGVNGSWIKFFARINLYPKIKTPGKLCARMWWKRFPTAEKWSQQNYEASRRRMGSIGLTVRKLPSKQSSNVAAEKARRISPALNQICPVSLDISGKSIRYVRSTQKLSSKFWFLSYEAPNWMKTGHKGHLKTWYTFPQKVFPKSKDFFFDFGLTQKI
jgi:hypothetical protein